MEVTLKEMGGSTVLVMPSSILKDLRIGAGQRLTLDTTQDGKIVLTPRHKYLLADLIAQCDLNAMPPSDLAGWNALPPAGQEIL